MSESAEGYAQAPAPTAPAAPAQPAAQENPPPATEAPQGIRRTLTAADGRKVEAELLARGEGTVKFRRLSDAQEFVFPLEKLSSEDQSFIRESALPVIAAR